MSNVRCKFDNGYLYINIEEFKKLKSFKFNLEDIFYLLINFLNYKTKFAESDHGEVKFDFLTDKTEITYSNNSCRDIIEDKENNIPFKVKFYEALIDAVHYMIKENIEFKYFKVNNFINFYDDYSNLHHIINIHNMYSDIYQMYYISNICTKFDVRNINNTDKILILETDYEKQNLFRLARMFKITDDDLIDIATHNFYNDENDSNKIIESTIYNNLEIIICDPKFKFKNVIRKRINIS